MVTKTEALYNALLPMKIVNFNEVVKKALEIIEANKDRRYIYRKYVDRLIKMGKLQAIRKELYAVISPLEKTEKHEVDKLLVASKIRQNYYLGFHTALEYYGCANSLLNEAYICVQPKDRFNSFHYKRFTFKPVFVKDVFSEIIEKPYYQTLLKVSSKERAFIECIHRVQYAGGWEECIKSLEGLSGLNFEKLLNLTLKQKSKTLLRRVGYVLELLKNTSPFYEHINEKLLNKIVEQTKGSPHYLIYGKKGPLNKKWNLYIPEDFEEKLRGI
jgi:predicted transcriptional regulator of viral defense system